MRPYFEKMALIGKPLTDAQKQSGKQNIEDIKKVEEGVVQAIDAVKNAGIPAATIKKRGQTTVWERIEYLVDPGTWCPLHTLYNPLSNEEGTTGVIDGLAKINGKWCVVIGFDNKVMAGAWIAGQADNQPARDRHLAKRLHIPLVWLVNCSGVKLTRAGRSLCQPARQRHHLLPPCRAGENAAFLSSPASTVPTRPAAAIRASARRSCSLHKDANIAVGGGGIVSGMTPKGSFDDAGLQRLIANATRRFARTSLRAAWASHYKETGFFTASLSTQSLRSSTA